MKKMTIIGHFARGETTHNGQTVKTKIVTEELQNQLGCDQVSTIDSHGGIKALLKAPFHVLKALKKSENVLIFPAHNGLRIYAPLLAFFRSFFKNRRLHYVVIGGWLPQFVEKRKGLKRRLQRFDGIYVETSTMKMALEQQGFTNVHVMPNCKKLTALKEDELVYAQNTPYKICTFSRVTKEKGIEDAVNAVLAVNQEFGYQAFSLDIYGQVDAGQAQWFEELKKTFPAYIRYGGLVPFDQSVETLKNYFALLFPTHYYTEGIPGTIIDAYAAGVPVISAKWESFEDIVLDGVTGIGYAFDTDNPLPKILKEILDNPQVFFDMKKNCLAQAQSYAPETVVREFIESAKI